MKQFDWWVKNVPRRRKQFEGWLGWTDNPSRKWFRDFIKEKNIGSVLDVACGTCIELAGLKENSIEVKYKGVDITPFLVEENKGKGVDCVLGNIEDIPEEDNSWEVVYGRHIIEHLEYYEKAIGEMCRVASKYVVIVHFLPLVEQEVIKKTVLEDGEFHENLYEEDRFIKFCEQFGEVTRIENDTLKNQTITYITLKNNVRSLICVKTLRLTCLNMTQLFIAQESIRT